MNREEIVKVLKDLYDDNDAHHEIVATQLLELQPPLNLREDSIKQLCRGAYFQSALDLGHGIKSIEDIESLDFRFESWAKEKLSLPSPSKGEGILQAIEKDAEGGNPENPQRKIRVKEDTNVEISEEKIIEILNGLSESDDQFQWIGLDDFPKVAKEILSLSPPINKEWISVETKRPLCYESGDWDGKRSDFVLIEDIHDKVLVARLYSGFMDGSDFNDWYDKDDFDVKYKVVRWTELPLQ